ncbi:MAG TPA: pentapeptide repeat-containing protein [Candidatus Aquilonibacter sp.]|nr:pentapeptide repeat-containing protein [Candidatus Aquilonibacter sp.]
MKWLALALCAMALFAVAQNASAEAKPTHCIGCDFSHADLHGRDLRGVDYIGVDFRQANLARVDFTGAKLVGADFQGADLRGANFNGVDCSGCTFRNARLDGATFGNVKLAGADLRGALRGLSDEQIRELLNHCTGCNLRGENLSGRNLSGATLTAIDLRDADVTSTRFENARLVGSDFRRADLRQADLSGAVVCWHPWEDGRPNTQTECVDLAGADVHGARLTNLRICDTERGVWTCSGTDAATLKRYSGNALEGAILR